MTLSLHLIILGLTLVHFLQATPAPQVNPRPPPVCNLDDWPKLPLKDIVPELRNANALPKDEAEDECRKATAKAPALAGAVTGGAHLECPKWRAPGLPWLVDCDAGTTRFMARLGGYDDRLVTFGDKDAQTCMGQMFCLPMFQDQGNCRVTLEFDPSVAALDRKDQQLTFTLEDKETWLQWRCASLR